MFHFSNLSILSFLVFFMSAFADDDCILTCPIGNALGSGIVQGSELLWDTTMGAFGAIKDFVLPPSQPSDTPATTDDRDPSKTDDFIHLNLVSTPGSNPQALMPNNCDPGNLLLNLETESCGIATKKIIWPMNCGDVISNTDILNALIAITGSAEKVGISLNSCGTFFWTASLTEDQMNRLITGTPGIDAVRPDTTGRWNSFSGARRRIMRRDTVLVEIDAPADLSYISTPQFAKNPNFVYARFPNAGRGVTVYIIDDGAVPTHKEFTTNNVIKGYIYALGSLPQNPDKTNHGHCIASKVGGLRDGVVKHADLIIVQIEIEISSLLDGLVRVLRDCQNRVEAGQKVHGYTVVQLAIGHRSNPAEENAIRLMDLIQELVERYQIIVVLASLNLGEEESYVGSVDIWEEILHRDRVPIILVGAVDMRTGNPPPFTTKIAQDLTVSAPDGGFCSDARWWNLLGRQLSAGNSLASALVSGLVADFLSRNYVRLHLGLDLPENQSLIAQVVRDYVVQKAFRRGQGTSLCVWNGLYFNDPSRVEP